MTAARFARVPIWAFRADITPRALRVLGAICAHVDAAGRAWPSLDRIAALSGVARNKIFAAIDELESAGLLHRDRATDGGRGNSTHYQVVFQAPETGPAVGSVIPENRSRFGTCLEAGNRSRSGTETGPNLGPRTERKKEEESVGARESESFMELTAAYPSRPDNPEGPAQAEFATALDRGILAEAIIAGAKRYAAYVAAHGIKPKYIAMLKTWLREERWSTDYAEPERPPRRERIGMF
jgi:hypothetical protein